MEKPELFDAYLLCSPSVSFNTDYFIKRLEEFVNSQHELKKTLVIVYGSAEGKQYYGDQYYFDMMNVVAQISRIFKEKSPRKFHWKIVSIPGGKHVPFGCVYEGLKSIFEGLSPIETPEISPSGGYHTFTKELAVSIKAARGEIHYTLDGSEPSFASKKYIEFRTGRMK